MSKKEHDTVEVEPVGGPSVAMPAGSPPTEMPEGDIPFGMIPAAEFAGGPPPGRSAGGPPTGMPVGGPPSGMPAGGPPSMMVGSGQDGQAPGPDVVSGALNLPAFGREYAMITMRDDVEHVALWYIDIRNFSSINPKYGFVAGNAVLRTLCSKIKEVISGELPVARLGGDRFVVLSEGFDYEAALKRFDILTEQVNEQGKALGINTQIVLVGAIYYLREPDFASHDFKRALDYTSLAHRDSKLKPVGSLVLFTDEDLERDTRRIILEQSIDQALMYGQIEVCYQPQVDYILGEVIGAEALARWDHPELGSVSPEEFVPVLENCGKISDLDHYIWDVACSDAGKWRNVSDGKPVPISVNVSYAVLHEPGIKEHFLDLMQKYDLPVGSLYLEVSEATFVEDTARIDAIVQDMRKSDLKVVMDDFGTGLSSLNMLKDVHVDVIKLDMSFMSSSINEERGSIILGSVIRMLQGLDTPIIAEGVETLDQAEMLKNMGCHLMQGFHFSHPLLLEEFDSYVESIRADDDAVQRRRVSSHLAEITSAECASSYVFNHAVGGLIFFSTDGKSSESLLVNDKFYEECGLDRLSYADSKIDPIREVDEQSRATFWRAAAEAREKGSALCRAKVRLSGRWIECVMRYLGPSARGGIYTLNICRSGNSEEDINMNMQKLQDIGFTLQLISRVVPNCFIKCVVDSDLSVAYATDSIRDIVGLNEDDFKRRFHGSFIEVVTPEYRANLLEAVHGQIGTSDLLEASFSIYRGLGEECRVSLIGRIVENEQDKPMLYALVMLRDLDTSDDEIQPEGSARAKNIIKFDYFPNEDKFILYADDDGGKTQDIVRENWLATLEEHPEIMAKTSTAKAIAMVRDLRHHPLSGFADLKVSVRPGSPQRWFHVNYTCDADENGDTEVIHGYAHNAEDQMGSAKWWRRQAEIDQLTGLLNRNAIEQEINLAMRVHGAGMMFMIDLDGFKRVNDELGHLVGDALLRDVASALQQSFRGNDLIGRYGGDEFVAFAIASPEDAYDIAQRRASDVLSAITSIKIPDGTNAGCSIGVAVSLSHDDTFYDLLEVADNAMYTAKFAGKGAYTVVDMNQTVKAGEAPKIEAAQ